MNRVEFESATFERIDRNIITMCVKPGVEVDEFLAGQYFDAIGEMTIGPMGLLVDMANPYSLTFGAQTKYLNRLPNIVATALLATRSLANQACQVQVSMLRTEHHKVGVFSSRVDAVHWLKEKVDDFRRQDCTGPASLSPSTLSY